MSLVSYTDGQRSHPLEVIERIAAGNNWSFERASDDEITLLVSGKWSDYQVSYTWMCDIEALHLACAFDLRVPERRRSEVQKLISMINEQMWVGHFDLWSQSGMVMHRQSLLLPRNLTATNAQCEMMFETAVMACERYFPAFQFVVWSGKTATDAMSAAMFDTVGEA